ncbi:TolC family protein [Telmatospirillum sp.]|uniref:TolC family protein n=1 Tax=Telmatospirillum sp. TaxID=2079197 RepID=UPI0028513C2B|nr:TolC family protein [Telmatospirillum sp.]MDR3440650.1 TolC family protein [Telmatospirillum sp.]
MKTTQPLAVKSRTTLVRSVVVFAAGFATLVGLAGCSVAPVPLTDQDRLLEATADKADVFGSQQPLTQPLTLSAAFDRALKYNLDARVKSMEAALAQDDLDLSNYDLLPKAGYTANLSNRSNLNAASSESAATGVQSLVPSYSTERNDLAANLTLSYNLLDFGVSYYAARQQANRSLIAEEQRRKVVQTLLQDVRRAFWRAASAQAISGRIVAAIHAAEATLPAVRRVESEGLHSPVDALRYQKELLTEIGRLEAAQQALAASKAELAALINLPPGQPFTIAVPGEKPMRFSAPAAHIADLESLALVMNPEIRQESYQVRISVDEAHKALLKLLPGITLSYGPNYDSNKFLQNNYWSSGSLLIAGYLNNLITAPAAFARAHDNEDVSLLRRRAMSMAVLARVHIAYEQYVMASHSYQRARQLADVDRRLYQQIANRSASDASGDLERISAQVSAVFSTLECDQSYADAQAALGRLYATLGVDLPSGGAEILDMAQLQAAVSKLNSEHHILESTVVSGPQTATPAPSSEPVVAPKAEVDGLDKLAAADTGNSAPSQRAVVTALLVREPLL